MYPRSQAMAENLRATLLVILLAVVPGLVRAGDNHSPFAWDPKVDIPITLGAALAGLVPDLLKDELAGPWCGVGCDPKNINGLDRSVVKNHSELSAHFSDGLAYTSLLLPHVVGFVDVLASTPEDGWGGYGKDTVVILETLSINYLLNNVVKFAVRRPRPYVYNSDFSIEERTKSDAALSFYSSHTATSFSMATATSYIYTLRHPDSPMVIPIWIGTHALAAVTGFLRVQAGKHFWSDVLVGAAVGSAIGLVVPVLHKTSESRSQTATLTDLQFEVRPTGTGITFGFVF
jgi:membrane-associated phospholipid phosphatase